MIFQHTIDAVLSGEKTQTRRIKKPGEYLGRRYTEALDVSRETPYYNAIFLSNGRLKWIEGGVYAVQGARATPAVAYFRLLKIREEDARSISEADVKAEGFETRLGFLTVWAQMHDPYAAKSLDFFKQSEGDRDSVVIDGVTHVSPFGARVVVEREGKASYYYDHLSYLKSSRPNERYDAWVLTFELVKE